MTSIADRLLLRLTELLALAERLFDASTINFEANRARRRADRTGVLIVGLHDGCWGPPSDEQRRLQREIMHRWAPLEEQVRLLFRGEAKARQHSVGQALADVRRWLEQGERALPPTTAEAKERLRASATPIVDALRVLSGPGGTLILVPDTNVLLRSCDLATYGAALDANSFAVLLVVGVLREMDGHKVNHRNPAVREKARKFSDRLKGWRNQGNLGVGVRVQGDVWVRTEAREPKFEATLSWLDPTIDDDRIIATVLEVQRHHPADRVVLLTGDTVMLTKADAASIPTADTPHPEVE